jgi:hypothetical protein
MFFVASDSPSIGAKISRKHLDQCGGKALSHGERVG